VCAIFGSRFEEPLANTAKTRVAGTTIIFTGRCAEPRGNTVDGFDILREGFRESRRC